MISVINFKRNILGFLGINLSLIGFLTLLCFIVDPFCIFHKPWFRQAKFFGVEVLMNLGQIESYLKNSVDFDTILVGTSHTENTLGDDVTQAVHGKGSLKLCLSGGRPIELECMIRTALPSKSLKNIVYGFEIYSFRGPANTPHPQREFPYELYRNKLRILFNKQNLKYSLGLSFTKHLYYDLNRLYYYWDWLEIQDMYKKYISEGAVEEYRKCASCFKDYKINRNFNDFSAIETHLLPLIRENPDINFYIPIIPYSWLWFTTPKHLDDAFALQRYLVEKCSAFKNVKIYGFHDTKIVNNIKNYYNFSHYQPDINRYMMHCIEHDLHRLTPENIDAYEQAMLKNLKEFEIDFHKFDRMDTLEDLIEMDKSRENL